MKKAVFLLCTLIIFNFSFLYSETENKAVKKDKKIIDITIGVGLRNIPEDSYKKIFGSNNLVYSADFGFRLWKSVELFLHTDYLSLKGKTTNTKEKTSFRLVPVEFGLRFLIEKKKISPYIGAGGGSYSYRDEMEIDNETSKVSGKKFGFFLETGLRYLFYKSIYVSC